MMKKLRKYVEKKHQEQKQAVQACEQLERLHLRKAFECKEKNLYAMYQEHLQYHEQEIEDKKRYAKKLAFYEKMLGLL